MVETRTIHLKTEGNGEIIDITQRIADAVAPGKINNGTATVFITGSTAGITTIEYESGLLSDFKAMWDRLIPRSAGYQHDSAWGEANGYSHVRASLLGGSLVVPISEHRLTLGTWQQIVLIDFDIRPRSREIIVQVIGE